MQNMAIASDV